MRSPTFEAAGNRDTKRLLVAISGSPSSKSGMTSDSFQRFGKTDDIRERFTISVIVGKMHCRAFLIATFRLQYEDDYEYEFSVLSTRFRFDGRKFSKCACSEL